MARGWDVLGWLGLEKPADEPGVLDAVTAVLDRLEEPRARYVAGFAYLLSRVARADHHVSDAEQSIMTRLVSEEAGLTEEEAGAVVRLALLDHGRFGGTHNLQVAREFAELSSEEQRLALLRCLFAVSAADDSIKTIEDNEIRLITRELRIEHADFVRARAEVREHLAVLRKRQ